MVGVVTRDSKLYEQALEEGNVVAFTWPGANGMAACMTKSLLDHTVKLMRERGLYQRTLIAREALLQASKVTQAVSDRTASDEAQDEWMNHLAIWLAVEEIDGEATRWMTKPPSPTEFEAGRKRQAMH